MMKKLGMVVFVMALVVAFALPAYSVTVSDGKDSSITIGGWFTLDTNYKGTDKNYNTYISPAAGGKDKIQFINDVPFWSFMYVMLKVGNVTGYADIATQISREYSNTQAYSGAFTNTADFLLNGKWYGAYKFGNCEFQAGKADGWLTSAAYGVFPSSAVGYSASNTTHVALIGWGWMYDGKNPNLRFKQDVNKMFGYQISLVDNGTYAETVGTATRLSYAQFPTVAAKIMLNFGTVALYPAAAYQHVQWDSLPAGYADNMTSWATLLPLIVRAGPFTGTMQIGYGQNTGGVTSGNVLMRGQGGYTGYQRSGGEIRNTTNLAAFFEAGFTAGPLTPHIWYSFDRAQNDNWKNIAGANDYYQKTTYGINAYYKINNNFLIVPELAFYDYGTLPGLPPPYKADMGKEWLAGIHFRFNF